MDDHKNVSQNVHTDPLLNTVLQSAHSALISHQLLSPFSSSRPIFISHRTHHNPFLFNFLLYRLRFINRCSAYSAFPLSFLYALLSICLSLNLFLSNPLLRHSVPSFTAPIHFASPQSSPSVRTLFSISYYLIFPLPHCQTCSNYLVFFRAYFPIRFCCSPSSVYHASWLMTLVLSHFHSAHFSA